MKLCLFIVAQSPKRDPDQAFSLRAQMTGFQIVGLRKRIEIRKRHLRIFLHAVVPPAIEIEFGEHQICARALFDDVRIVRRGGISGKRLARLFQKRIDDFRRRIRLHGFGRGFDQFRNRGGDVVESLVRPIPFVCRAHGSERERHGGGDGNRGHAAARPCKLAGIHHDRVPERRDELLTFTRVSHIGSQSSIYCQFRIYTKMIRR